MAGGAENAKTDEFGLRKRRTAPPGRHPSAPSRFSCPMKPFYRNLGFHIVKWVSNVTHQAFQVHWNGELHEIIISSPPSFNSQLPIYRQKVEKHPTILQKSMYLLIYSSDFSSENGNEIVSTCAIGYLRSKLHFREKVFRSPLAINSGRSLVFTLYVPKNQ